MAEREGFEPPEPFGSMVFKTTAIDHSAISPVIKRLRARDNEGNLQAVNLVNLNNEIIFFLIVSVFFYIFFIYSLKIGITGGIGCGKSTVLEFLEANGFACLSADAVVRRLLSEDKSVIELSD